MKIVIQRVSHASCTVDGKITGKIDKGLLLLIGFKNGDTKDDFAKVIRKLHGIRIKIERPEDESHGGVQSQARNPLKTIGRNDKCPCGSGLKFKNCTCKEYHPDLYKK